MKRHEPNESVSIEDASCFRPMNSQIQQVILIPGLLEPRAAFWPLKRRLRQRCERVEYFHDRYIFRNVQHSIERLAEKIGGANANQSIAIVTHSFGDWVARQAIAQTSTHGVAALVSVAPVMRGGLMPLGLRMVSGNLIPEIKIITNPESAAANLELDSRVRRLVIWAKADASVRCVPLDGIATAEHVPATHLSVILQPGVQRTIEAFLFADGSR